ncbi:MAG: hypothetical protein IPL52_03995 [Flavobacteriales bacterium]|nr:hypothetical protein [Flavobacteriales bacterium]
MNGNKGDEYSKVIAKWGSRTARASPRRSGPRRRRATGLSLVGHTGLLANMAKDRYLGWRAAPDNSIRLEMASIQPGQCVTLTEALYGGLVHPPPRSAELFIGVHNAALRAPRDKATVVAGFLNNQFCWLGGVGEDHLLLVPGERLNARASIFPHLMAGSSLWSLIQPGELIKAGTPPLGAVYRGSRPWLVLGDLQDQVLAAPLNDASGNPKWYTPIIERKHVRFHGSTKDSQVELPHLWSLPKTFVPIGDIAESVRDGIESEVRRYFR